MKWSFTSVGLIVFALVGLTILILFQNITTGNENDYYLLKEVTEASMIDAIDMKHYKETGELKIIKDLGFESAYIHPWKTCNNEKDVMDYLSKELNIYIDENGDGSTFDGYAFVGEIEKAEAEKLSNYYI